MKKDKPEVSFKINGKEIDVNQEEDDTRQDGSGSELEKLPIKDWRENETVEKEHAAALWEEKPHVTRPGLPLKNKRKKPNVRRKPVKKLQRKSKPNVLYFISITGGAVALGLLFGIVMLQLFSGDNPSTRAAFDTDDQSPPIVANYNDSLTMYVIQAGAFTSKGKGREMQDNMHAQGYPAILTHDGEYYYLFTGITFQEESFQQLKSFYEEEGLEIYEKTRIIPEPEKKEGRESEREALLMSKKLLADLTEAAILTGESDDSSLIETLDTHIKATKEWEEKENALSDMRAALEEIKGDWTEEKKSTSAMQEKLMEAILYYEEAVYVFNEGEQKEEKESEKKDKAEQ